MRKVGATLRAAINDAAARRASFVSQIVAMVANDVAWVAFWIIFFHRVKTVRGWDTHRVLLLFAILTTAGGLVLGLLSNARRIPQLITDGALDETLSLPVSPLPHLLVRRIDAVNIGDVGFGVCLFLASAHINAEHVVVYVLGVLASATLLTGFLVTTGSFTFFTGGAQGADLALHSILLLASYPADIFSGATRAMLYTVIPAAFVTAVPARLIDSFDAGRAAELAGSAATFALLGFLTFSLGLRRYTSGSSWSRA